MDSKKCSPAIIQPQYFLQTGDLLLARSGSVGRSYLHTATAGDFQFAGYLIRYRANPKIVNPRYLFYTTKTGFWFEWIRQQSKAATLANINARQFSQFSFPCPSLDEQERIVAKLDKQMATTNRAIVAAENELRELRALPAAFLRAELGGH